MEELGSSNGSGVFGLWADWETVLLDAGSPVMVRRGGIVDQGEMVGNVGGRKKCGMGAF